MKLKLRSSSRLRGTSTLLGALVVLLVACDRTPVEAPAEAVSGRALAVTVGATMTITGSAAGTTYPAFGDQRAATVGRFDGLNGLVVYVDSVTAAPSLEAIRIDDKGAPIGTSFTLATGVDVEKPAVACNAASCFVAYASSGRIRGLRVDPAGVVLDAVPFDFGAQTQVQSIAAYDDGSGVVVAWSDRSGTAFAVYARRISSTGVLAGGAPVTLTLAVSGSADVSVSAFGGTTVVAWDDATTPTVGRIQGSRLDATGALLDVTPVTLVDAGSIAETLPRLVSRSSDLLMVYRQSDQFYAAPVVTGPTLSLGAKVQLANFYSGTVTAMSATTDGTTTEVVFGLCSSACGISRITIPPAITGAGTQSFINYPDAIDTAEVVLMASGRVVVSAMRRERPGAPMTNGLDVYTGNSSANLRILSLGASSATTPTASFIAPSQFAVAYTEDDTFRASRGSLTRFASTSTGARLDATNVPFVIGASTATDVEHIDNVALSSIGSSHLLVWRKQPQNSTGWNGSSSYETTSVDQSTPANVGILRTLTSVTPPWAVVSGPSAASLYWYNGYSVADQLITPSSQTAGSIVSSTSTQGYSKVHADGTHAVFWNTSALVVFTQGRSTGVAISAPIADDGTLSVANGTRSTLVVRRAAAGGAATQVVGLLLSAAGTSVVKSTFSIASAPGLISPVRVAFDGTYYDVVTIRGANVELTRVDEDGVVIDPTPSVVATNAAGYTREPAVASNRAGTVLVAYETFDATRPVRAMRVATVVINWNGTGTGAADGQACSTALQCQSGRCIDGVCCQSTCGFGANDCQACSVAAGGTQDGVCTPLTSAPVCRPAAGVCDVAETCSPTSTTCPADSLLNGTLCGATAGTPCETDQRCDGVSVSCPAKAPRPNTTLCRAASGACDLAEYCTGSSLSCPADGVRSSATLCRAAATICDVAEFCSGSSPNCGTDLFVTGYKVCRPATGVCDAPEACDGTVTCPPDLPSDSSTTCRLANGICDVSENCDGTSFTCPPDTFAAATLTCRPSAGACDSPETCTGASATCPNDARKPAATVCRASAGPCDVAEVCNGTSATCGSDQRLSQGTVCRPAAGVCDSAEACSGTDVKCPNDRLRVDGSACSNGLICDGSEMCQAGACVAGEPLVCEADSPCLESTGECSVASRPSTGCSVSAPGAGSRPAAPVVVWAVIAALALRSRRVRQLARRPWKLFPVLALCATALGGCVCGVGSVSCDGACVDVGYDERNCGACGVSCGYGQCIEGVCTSVPATLTSCESDAQCADANACNGVERCVASRCRAGDAVVCDDGITCTSDRCDPALGSCVATPQQTGCGISP